jgi:hypothetical protein
MSCCDTTTLTASGDGNCSTCDAKGVQVPVITVKALMTGPALKRGVPQAPRFCASATCSVVYYDDVSVRRVDEDELTVSVYAKHSHELDIPVCYCFGYSLGMIENASAKQTTPVSDVVRAEVEAGHCACEVKNPKGACCLGDIMRIERRIDGEAKTG